MAQVGNFKTAKSQSRKCFKGLTVIPFLLLSLFLFMVSNPAKAQHHRHFTWTYESTTMQKGAFDVEPWITYSTGREHFYNRYERRLEFEAGLTNNLQTAFYFNAEHEAKAVTDSTDKVIGMEQSSGFSFSNEWLVNVLNPSTAPVGIGLYGEYTIAPNEIELEPKLLLEKKTAKSIFAYNLVGEYEFEYEYEQEANEIAQEKEVVIENDLAYMYLFDQTFGLGVEARNHNEIVEGKWEHSALFVGPTLFYSQGNLFAMVNVLPQIGDLKNGGMALHEHEKLQTRLILGFTL